MKAHEFFAALTTDVQLEILEAAIFALTGEDGKEQLDLSDEYAGELVVKLREFMNSADAQAAAQDRTHLLKPYRVFVREDVLSPTSTMFDCDAEDNDHAYEQADNAYPEGTVLEIIPRFTVDSPKEELK